MNSKSKRYCSVPQCSNYFSKTISLHYFPTNELLSRKWKNVLKIGKEITKYMSVCSEHFLKEDFTIITPHTKVKRLKKGVIPSQKLPVGSHSSKRKIIDQSEHKWLNEVWIADGSNNIEIDHDNSLLPVKTEDDPLITVDVKTNQYEWNSINCNVKSEMDHDNTLLSVKTEDDINLNDTLFTVDVKTYQYEWNSVNCNVKSEIDHDNSLLSEKNEGDINIDDTLFTVDVKTNQYECNSINCSIKNEVLEENSRSVKQYQDKGYPDRFQ